MNSDVLEINFPNALVEVREDTYAAVRSSINTIDEAAVVCILGTGSNCSYFDGKILHQKVQSLGYIAMDDGSGNRFGRHLIRGYYFNTMPADLAKEFQEIAPVHQSPALPFPGYHCRDLLTSPLRLGIK